MLTMIAEADMRTFIMAPDCLIAPYDGGMDIVLIDPHTCWSFKRRFADWLPDHPSAVRPPRHRQAKRTLIHEI
jgi:hypothetical protein